VLKSIPAIVLICGTLSAQEPSLESLRQDGRWKQVQARIDGWYRANPQDPYALLWMSRVKQAFGQLEEALDLARKAVAAKGDDPDIQTQLASTAGMSAGSAEGIMKQYSFAREMKKAGEAALALKPDHKEAAEMMVMYYLQAPAIVGGGEGKAKTVAQQLTRTQPVAGLILQATIAYQKKDQATYRALVQQALAKDPASADALMAQATIHLLVKPQELDAALAVYRKVLAIRPRQAAAHAQIAAILAEQGKWAELDAAFAEARRQLPDSLWPYYAAGKNLLDENRDLDRAETFLRVYLTQAPEGGTPSLAAAHWRLAQIREKQGKKAEAIAELELALKVAPAFKPAKKDLERLRKG